MSLYAILNSDKNSVKSFSEFDPNLRYKSGYYLPVIDINPNPMGTLCTYSINITPTGVIRTFVADYINYRNQLFSQIDQKLSQQIQAALTGSYSLNRDDLMDRLLAQKDYLYAQLSGCSNSGLISFLTGIQQFIPPTNFSGQSSILTNLLLTGQYNYQFASGLKDNLIQSGINLYNTITGLNLIFSTVNSLTQTGQKTWNKPQFSITFNSSSVTWTNMPAAANYFNASALYTSFADLTNYTGVQLVVSKLATAAAATGVLFLRYSSTPAQTFANFLDIDTGPCRLGVNVASVMVNSGYFPLVAGAKSGVYMTLCGSGGSAAVSPVFGMVTANFK